MKAIAKALTNRAARPERGGRAKALHLFRWPSREKGFRCAASFVAQRAKVENADMRCAYDSTKIKHKRRKKVSGYSLINSLVIARIAGERPNGSVSN